MMYMSVTATRLDKAMITNEQTITPPCVLVGSMFLLVADASRHEPIIVINNQDAEKANAHTVSSQARGP
jgi:hypothetical protein